MLSPIAIAFQGTAALMGLTLAVLCPQPGSASRLVPLGGASASEAAMWAVEENAQLLSFEPQTRSFTVIAPNARGLLRVVSYGFVPISAQLPSCLNEQGGASNTGSLV
ncbi:MAG: hypothetical protein AAF559_00125 [Pseudomonadota bacterium]